MPSTLVTPQDINAAQYVIAGHLHRTPLQGSSFLSDQIGARIHLKLELFQKTGSFKPRGVMNRLHHMSPEEKSNGVITLSAGNHAQAVAWAARREGIPATVIMPANAVQAKVDATRGYGGEVIQTDDNLMEVCKAVQSERGLTLVHPFDHPQVIAGQGTVGQEIFEEIPDVDLVIAGVGGGGLISGVAAAVKQARPRATVIGVEPEGAPTMTRSLAENAPAHLDHVDTVADGLAAPFVGAHNLAHVQAFVDEVIQVPDEEIIKAMWLIIERCKVIPEPAAASTVAALLSGKVSVPQGGQVVCILSGGNVDRARLKQMA